MTAVTHGADPEALQRLAEDMLNHAEHTLGVGIRTQNELATLRWSGPDAERARQHWESVELPRIRNVSKALAEAAGVVLEEARQQRQVSEQANGAAAPSGTPVSGVPDPSGTGTTAGTSATLLERARTLADALTTGPELAQVAAVVAAGGRGALAMTRDQYALISSLIGASKPAVGATLRAAGHVGNVLNVYDAGAGMVRGDAVQATSGIGGLAAGAAGGPAVGAAWGAGWFIGTQVNEGIQGTSYGDAFERRNEAAFDTLGAGGMFIVPGNLAVAAWDVLTDGGGTSGEADDEAGGSSGGR